MRICSLVLCAAILAACSHATDSQIVPARAAYRAFSLQSNSAGKYQELYNFKGGYDASYPAGGLIDVHGTIYGTSGNGGSPGCNKYGCGTVYSLGTSGTEHVLYAFTDGKDGVGPAGLIDVNGTLYGVSGGGGTSCFNGGGCGTIFSMTTAGKKRVLYRFKGGTDGASPNGLVNVNGTLYGTTYAGGGKGCYAGYGCGTVFKVTTAGAERVLYRFQGGTDGGNPYAVPIDVKGTLYGTTYIGGDTSCGVTTGCGTVYSVSTTGQEHVLYGFKGGTDAGNTTRGLIEVNGLLYGASNTGGGTSCHLQFESAVTGCGTIFTITTGGTEKVLYRFQGLSDGADPHEMIYVNGIFYGTTLYGGGASCINGDGCGTIFSLTPKGVERVLYRFYAGVEENPTANLLYIKGTLYGAALYGGLNGRGAIFAFTP